MSFFYHRVSCALLAAACLAVPAYSQAGQVPAHAMRITQQFSPLTAPPALTGPSLDWDQTFRDARPATPLHFTAAYQDSIGKLHHLEEWRLGQTHLRRRTDDRIDLHADAIQTQAKDQPIQYQWQVLDLQQKVDHRISSTGMLRLGMPYSYYSMAHVLTRPANRFEIHAVPGLKPVFWTNTSARWFDISIAGKPVTRVCWDATLGIPLRTLQYRDNGWTETFRLTASDTKVSTVSLTSDTKGFQVRDIAEIDPD